LDLDRDGYIEPVDIIRYFGDDDPIELVDLNKLMHEKIKDSKEKNNINLNTVPRLDCADFTKWVGDVIHEREGFYFRHDSMKHPIFDQHQSKQEIF
jgi:hypothetical protein